VGLVASVVFGAETPVNVREDWLVLKVCYAEDAAAYFLSLLTAEWRSVVKKGFISF